MMNTRLAYLLIGCVIGFVLGYIVRSIREIKEKVEEVDQHVLREKNDQDKGAISSRAVTSIGMVLVVGLTAWAAFSSQKSSNDVKAAQHRQDVIVKCDQKFLAHTIAAANARTVYSVSQSNTNVALQKAFNKVVTASLQKPPLTQAEARKVVVDYSIALQTFFEVSGKNSDAITNNPYPKVADLISCINQS